MDTITKLMMASLCGLTLSACGGGGDNGNAVPQGSIAACFTVPGTVSFEVNVFDADNNMPGAGGYSVRTVGPGTFNGQTATQSETVSSMINPSISPNPIVISDSSVYWAVTDSGIALLGQTLTTMMGATTESNYIANPAPVIPMNMQPGQSVSLPSAQVVDVGLDAAPAGFTFIGLETLTLSGKIFSNVCHFQLQDTPAGGSNVVTNNFWYAPGYGEVQSESPATATSSSAVSRYVGASN
jgi:hypothetical protein